MENVVITFGERVCTEESANGALSTNGGEYSFFETPVLIDGVESGVLRSTSADFDYCELGGGFTKTDSVRVEGAQDEKGKPVYVAASYYGEEYISLEDFKKAI